MKIKVKEIPRQGLQISETLSTDAFCFNEDEFKIISAPVVTGDVYKSRDTVNAQVNVAAKYGFVCARCLDPVVVSRSDDFKFDVSIQPTTDYVDFGDEIRQQMLLNISSIVLCRQDCRGLCPSCGANLNNEKCKCKK